jgi:hypothetical protein
VTDDKTLGKAERKQRQVESAHKKTDRAKILKLADKTSNLRALVSSPAPDWSVRRKIEYIKWARKVVQALGAIDAPRHRPAPWGLRGRARAPAGGYRPHIAYARRAGHRSGILGQRAAASTTGATSTEP